jgi:hypothetical protein
MSPEDAVMKCAVCWRSALVFVVVTCAFPSLATAAIVTVTANGVVEFNQINDGFLGNVNPGDAVTMTFTVDSGNFLDSPNFPTRGYEIDQSSFSLAFNGSPITLQNPFPSGETPWFVIRNDDPAVDGFFVATSVDFPVGVPLDQAGAIEQFRNNFSVTYEGSTLNSLDVLDALGFYDFSGLTVFNWTVDDGPFQPLGMVFSDLTISASVVPEPVSAIPVLLTGAGVLVRRRRR